MDSLNTLGSMGFAWPSPAYLLGSLLFGLVGWGAYRYGKKNALPRAKWIGLALMLYPYAISATWLLYAVGALLCGALYMAVQA